MISGNTDKREALASKFSGDTTKESSGQDPNQRKDEDMKDQNRMNEKRGIGIGKHCHPAVPH